MQGDTKIQGNFRGEGDYGGLIRWHIEKFVNQNVMRTQDLNFGEVESRVSGLAERKASPR